MKNWEMKDKNLLLLYCRKLSRKEKVAKLQILFVLKANLKTQD